MGGQLPRGRYVYYAICLPALCALRNDKLSRTEKNDEIPKGSNLVADRKRNLPAAKKRLALFTRR